MTTWTPKTKQGETWTEGALIRVFSPSVFSHATYTGKTIFAVGTLAGVWDARTKQAETWTVEV